MKKGKSGFTLLELLVVVGILAALVALALPFYQDYVNQSKLTAAEADLQTFKKALAMYDQLESSMFGDVNLLPLVGKYLQDYRATADQEQPIDPWSNDYRINVLAGSIWSCGPDGQDNSAGARVAGGDDILVTWKPDFFLSTAKRINNTTLEISFTRKIKPATLDATAVTATVSSGSGAGTTVQRISDSIFRIAFNNGMLATTGNITVAASVEAQDGRTLALSFKPDGTAANLVGF